MTFCRMDSRETDNDPDEVVDLQVTLSDGLPLPMSMLSEVKNRDDNTEVVIETKRMNVRLRTSGPSPATSDRGPAESMYPGLVIDPRLGLFIVLYCLL